MVQQSRPVAPTPASAAGADGGQHGYATRTCGIPRAWTPTLKPRFRQDEVESDPHTPFQFATLVDPRLSMRAKRARSYVVSSRAVLAPQDVAPPRGPFLRHARTCQPRRRVH